MPEECPDYPVETNFTLLKEAVQPPPFSLNTQIPYRCNFGYILSDSKFIASGGAKFTCKSVNNVATWEMDTECKPISCGDPGHVEHASRKGHNFTFSQKVAFECDDGYKRIGPAFRFCDVNGHWIPPLNRIKCVPATSCAHLEPPVNGFITYTNNRSIGSEAHYSCNESYQLSSGNRIRTCSEKATWTGNAPECKKKCPDPFPHDSIVTPKQNTYVVGDVIVYHCPITNQTMSVICKENGDWSNPPPLCELKQQPLPKKKPQNVLKEQKKTTKKDFYIIYIICSAFIILIVLVIYKTI